MKNLSFSTVCKAALMASAVTFAVACTSANRSTSLDHEASVQDTGLRGPAAARGGMDHTGGNGTQGKMYESYRVNPLELPAYKKVAAKQMAIYQKLEKAKNIEDDPDGTTEYLPLEILWKLKSWYLVPERLQRIPKDQLGVGFIKSQTEQYALQTARSVWIDKLSFNAMPPAVQADLLVHEYVMQAFLYMRATAAEQCELLWAGVFGSSIEACVKNVKPGPNVGKPLTDRDYEVIRGFTSFLMSMTDKTTLEEYKYATSKFLLGQTRDFAKQLNKVHVQGPNAPEMLAILKSAAALGSVDGPCYGLKSQQQVKSCKLELNVVASNPAVAIDIEITIRNRDTNQVIRKAAFKIPAYNSIVSYETPAKEIYNYTSFMSVDSTAKEGDILNALGIVYTESFAYRKVVGLIFHPMSVYAVNESETTNPNTVCQRINYAPSPGRTMGDDVIVMTTDKNFIETEDLTARYQGSSFTSCSQKN